MRTRYLIQELETGAYWDNVNCRFKGILFADYYESKEEALLIIEEEIMSSVYNTSYYVVLEVYIK